MTPQVCLDVFEAAPEDKERSPTIDRSCPECVCENCRVSKYCGDPVESSETLVRLVLDPTHIEHENGLIRLKSSFFSDAASFGSSCLRYERAVSSEYVKTIEEMLLNNPLSSDGTPKKLYGIVNLKVTEVKSVQHETKDKSGNIVDRAIAFCVYATGLDGRPNHSDVMVNRVSSISRNQANRAGINLTKKINEEISKGRALVSVADFKHIVDLSAWAAQ